MEMEAPFDGLLTSSLLWKPTFLFMFISFYYFSSTFSGTHVRTVRVQVATPLFSLLSPERSSLAVFAGVQDVVHPVFHVSFK